MDQAFTKEEYQKAAIRLRGWEGDRFYVGDKTILISDLLENAITNLEIIEQYLHSVNPIISKRCQNCGQKLRVKVDKHE